MQDLKYHKIISLDDPVYDDWLDIYQASFPLSEQVRVSEFNRMLRKRSEDADDEEHLLAVMDFEGKLAAMAWFDVIRSCDSAALWYLAVAPDRRSGGVGSQVYQYIRSTIQEMNPATRALFFEVEDPKTAQLEEDQNWANRRIAFYQRNGAKLLGGIHYVQSVGWQPPIPMCLMVHADPPLSPRDAFDLAKCVFETSLTKVDTLVLD